MIRLLLEGVSSTLLPCSLTVLVPGVAVFAASRKESFKAMIAFLVALVVFAWFPLSGRGPALPDPLIALAFLAGGVLLLIPLIRRIDIVSMAGGIAVAWATASLWQPCVGEEFGMLLNSMPNRGISGFILLSIYLAGLTLPLSMLTAAAELVPGAIRSLVSPLLAVLGGFILAMATVGVALGFHERLLEQLFVWSL